MKLFSDIKALLILVLVLTTIGLFAGFTLGKKRGKNQTEAKFTGLVEVLRVDSVETHVKLNTSLDSIGKMNTELESRQNLIHQLQAQNQSFARQVKNLKADVHKLNLQTKELKESDTVDLLTYTITITKEPDKVRMIGKKIIPGDTIKICVDSTLTKWYNR